MATKPQLTGLTYADLERLFPEDDMRIVELIDGELFVTPPPSLRHQDVVLELGSRLLRYAKERGGKAYVAPTGVHFEEPNFVEPDVFYIRPDSGIRTDDRLLYGPPDLVVEVSSPSTKRRDRTKKRDLYERFGVPEYWFVDLEEDRIAVYRRSGDRFADPVVLGRGDLLEADGLAGFSCPVEELLGPPEDDTR